MPVVTALQVMTDAFRMLNVYMSGDTILAVDSTDALRWLNLMIGQWAQQNLTIPAEARLIFPLVTGKGSPANPYTIGAGGDLNTPKPPNQNSLIGAGLLLNASTPPVEIPRGVMTNDGYDRQHIKDLTSALFTNVFYLPTFASSLGQIFLYPIPTDTTNSLVLYIRAGLSTFADLTTQYSIPDGYDEALYAQLMKRLAVSYGRTLTDDQKELARNSFATIQRSNLQLSDLENDFAHLGGGHGGGHNIQTGDGG
jgi:hypothetical protein